MLLNQINELRADLERGWSIECVRRLQNYALADHDSGISGLCLGELNSHKCFNKLNNLISAPVKAVPPAFAVVNINPHG
jgi:hypothetical protein